MTRTLLAFDIDGVLNSFSKNGKGIKRVEINGFPVGWRPQIIERVKALLALPGVEGAWLTTWLSEPSMIDELVEHLGLTDDHGAPLIRHRAAYPHVVKLAYGGETIDDPRFPEGTKLSPGSPRWWKFSAAKMLIDELKPDRFGWLDDDLGRARGVPGDEYRPADTSDQLLFRTHDVAGLLEPDMDRIETWVRDSPHRADGGVQASTRNDHRLPGQSHRVTH